MQRWRFQQEGGQAERQTIRKKWFSSQYTFMTFLCYPTQTSTYPLFFSLILSSLDHLFTHVCCFACPPWEQLSDCLCIHTWLINSDVQQDVKVRSNKDIKKQHKDNCRKLNQNPGHLRNLKRPSQRTKRGQVWDKNQTVKQSISFH